MKYGFGFVTAAATLVTLSSSALELRNVAHRGLWIEAGLPQNTVEAIKAAYDAGAKMVETDFVLTDAGEMICLHDIKALATMTTDVVEPRKITPADRARINLGEKAKLPRPYRIPTLEEVLTVVPKDAILQSEIKGYGETYAKRFDDAVKAAGLVETNILVSSFQYEWLRDFRRKYPKYRTLWLGTGVKKGFDVGEIIAKAKDAGFDIVCPGCERAREAELSPADADRIRAAGLDLRLYGVNDLESLRYAVKIGATGFTCNTFRKAYEWAREVPGAVLIPKLR